MARDGRDRRRPGTLRRGSRRGPGRRAGGLYLGRRRRPAEPRPGRRVSDVVRDPQLLLSEFAHVRPGADGACYTTPGKLASFSRTPRFGPMRSPGIGEHAREVLRTAGLTDPEVD